MPSRRSRDGQGQARRARPERRADVFGQVEVDRPRRLGAGEAERLGKLAPTSSARRARLAFVIGAKRAWWSMRIWMRRSSQGVEHVAGDRQHRGAVEPGGADAGSEVGRAGAEGRDADAGHARQGAHGGGHEAGAMVSFAVST